MTCAWKALIGILPQWMRADVDRLGSDSLQEIRLRIDKPPELVRINDSVSLSKTVNTDDISFCINAASRYSPWASKTSKYGYITAPGGHRIGICGQAVVTDDKISGIGIPGSLCIRVARDFPGLAEKAGKLSGSVLIIGRPGSGKTTLLRDLIRIRSDKGLGSVGVVDEKGELFPRYNGKFCFEPGCRTDVLSGCNKAQGIDAILRNMGPTTIAVDEITAEEDCVALAGAGWCGVDLIATAHAGCKQDLYHRKVYKTILDNGLFDHLIILRQDKTWYMEGM